MSEQLDTMQKCCATTRAEHRTWRILLIDREDAELVFGSRTVVGTHLQRYTVVRGIQECGTGEEDACGPVGGMLHNAFAEAHFLATSEWPVWWFRV